jgi:hypothetical protein
MKTAITLLAAAATVMLSGCYSPRSPVMQAMYPPPSYRPVPQPQPPQAQQVRFDGECRQLPPDGYMMQPGPVDAGCAERRQEAAAIQANEKAEHDRSQQAAVARVQAKYGSALETAVLECRGYKYCDELLEPVWLKLEADNGRVTLVDVKSITKPIIGSEVSSVADVVIYTYVPGAQFNPDMLREIRFDCHGTTFSDILSRYSSDVPPRSVIGRVRDIACNNA